MGEIPMGNTVVKKKSNKLLAFTQLNIGSVQKTITYLQQRDSQSHTDILRTLLARSPIPGTDRRATTGSSTRAGTRIGTRLSGNRNPSGVRTVIKTKPSSAMTSDMR